LSDEIKTKDYFERLELLIDIGDIFVALDGGSGTLLEVSALITLMEREFIDNRKLILFGKKWDFLYSFLENSSVKSNIFFPKDFLQFSEILKRIN
jgi:predicted Rossmann-fold nucleotide-binding protein